MWHVKITIYLPEELEIRLEAESTATGVSKAELIRRGIAMVLEASTKAGPLPAFDSGRARSSEELDRAVYEHVRNSAARR